MKARLVVRHFHIHNEWDWILDVYGKQGRGVEIIANGFWKRKSTAERAGRIWAKKLGLTITKVETA